MLSSERTKTKPNSQSKLKPQYRNGESDLDKKKVSPMALFAVAATRPPLAIIRAEAISRRATKQREDD